LTDGFLRIGELSRRVGVSADTLRAWERRYGLLSPTRSAGGLRLYSPDDVARVGVMQSHLAGGLAAAEAAALAAREPLEEGGPGGVSPRPPDASPECWRDELGAALESLDEPRAQAVLDRLLAAVTVDALLGEVVMPYLRTLGRRWELGEVSVAHEHFASGLLRGRLLGLARGWGRGVGPAAVLACLPGEQHDLGLIAFGLALRARGWRILYLGADSPVDALVSVAGPAGARLIVVSAVSSDRVTPVASELAELARTHRIALGGAAATAEALAGTGVLLVGDDVIGAADRLTAELA
jgi:DNA-binding transcriptional MerR regulator